MSWSGTTRRASRGLVAGALVATLLAAGASSALADPTPPSQQDVDQAKGAVKSAERSVASMEVRLAQLSAQTDAADLKVAQAGEAYTQALSDADAAQQAWDDSVARSKAADALAEDARRQLVAIAREVARSGGSNDLLQAMLSADGFQDVARRTTALDQITGKADRAVQQYRATQLVATTLATRAADAADEAKAAKAAAADALAAAEKAQSDAVAAQASAAAERDSLITSLAAARQTSAAVERERQDFLDQQRRDREEAAARTAALRPPAVVVSTPPATTRPPASGGTTAPPTTTTPPATTTPPVTTPPVTTTPPVVTTPPPATPTPPPATTPAPPKYGLGTGTSRGSAAGGAAALAWAQTKIGLPYIWGGVGPAGYDCSGLTMTAWRTAGVNLARTTRDQYKQVLKISYNELRPGDLVFWSTDPNNADAIYHVAIWAGNGQIMEASKPGDPLRVTSMRWGSTMPYAGRP
ncbi:NlpC/P60 family protein [Cellulomonas sp. ICMP 17802]|uniref:C40 family peptidase n=1 Tax=Cellulomonas sp. ICMP 17802 TaxID=3239199 RepID=UPI00351B2877